MLDPPDGADWTHDGQLTRSMGDAWLAGRITCLARVPSAIVSEAWNYLLDPQHPDAARVEVVAETQEKYDLRLFRLSRS